MTRPVETEVSGHNGADLLFIADCLEGKLGDGRRIEACEPAAKFIRDAVAQHQNMTQLVVRDLPPVS